VENHFENRLKTFIIQKAERKEHRDCEIVYRFCSINLQLASREKEMWLVAGKKSFKDSLTP
jgi:hypothetical protein